MREFEKFDDPNDPAMAPVREAGGGEAEGFEMAEEELVEHASHGDDHGTTRIINDAGSLGEESESVPDPDLYGEADEERESDI